MFISIYIDIHSTNVHLRIHIYHIYIYHTYICNTRLGVLDASECPPTFQVQRDRVIGIIAGGDVALRLSSEGKEDEVDGAVGALIELSIGKYDTGMWFYYNIMYYVIYIYIWKRVLLYICYIYDCVYATLLSSLSNFILYHYIYIYATYT